MARARKVSPQNLERVFRQGAVYSFIKKNPGSQRAEIMARFGMTDAGTSNVLHRMRKGGYIKVHGHGATARWYACDRARGPEDRRGTAEGSLRALEPSQQRWRENLKKAAIANGQPEDHFQPKEVEYKPRFALDALWPSPVIAILGQTSPND